MSWLGGISRLYDVRLVGRADQPYRGGRRGIDCVDGFSCLWAAWVPERDLRRLRGHVRTWLLGGDFWVTGGRAVGFGFVGGIDGPGDVGK